MQELFEKIQPPLAPPLLKHQNPLGQAGFGNGGRTGTRTLNQLIKSQLLYQLSYSALIKGRGASCENLA